MTDTPRHPNSAAPAPSPRNAADQHRERRPHARGALSTEDTRNAVTSTSSRADAARLPTGVIPPRRPDLASRNHPPGSGALLYSDTPEEERSAIVAFLFRKARHYDRHPGAMKTGTSEASVNGSCMAAIARILACVASEVDSGAHLEPVETETSR